MGAGPTNVRGLFKLSMAQAMAAALVPIHRNLRQASYEERGSKTAAVGLEVASASLP